MADHIHILKNGDTIKSDQPKAIYENPEFISVANILGEVNLLPIGTLGKSQKKLSGIWSENILIGSQNNSKYTLKLKLTEKLYIGNYFRYQFQLSESQSLVVKSFQSELKVGECYTVIFPEAHLFLLKED